MRIVSLGLSSQDITLETIQAMAARVSRLVGRGGSVLIIASTPLDRRIVAVLASLLGGEKVKFLDTTDFQIRFFRPVGFEWSIMDAEYDAIVSLSNPQLYLLDAKYVQAFFGPARFLVLPFAPQTTKGDVESLLPSVRPVIFNGWPWAGVGRAEPTVTALLRHLSFVPGPYVPGHHHRRLVKRATRHLDASRSFFPFGSFDQDALDAHLDAQALVLDDHHFAITHETHDAKVLARHPDIRFVYLIRDPRDIVVSLHQRLLQNHLDDDLGEIASASSEEDLLRIIEGFDYVGRRRAFLHRQPPLDRMAATFLEARHLPNVFVLRFEDIRLRPGETYRKLHDWLAEGRTALAPLEEETLAGHIAKGTFEHQSGGAREDGDGLNGSDAPATGTGLRLPFRKGTVGDWKNHFTPRLKDLIKETAGDLLIALGYENDLDW